MKTVPVLLPRSPPHPQADGDALPPIQAALQAKDLLPNIQLADTGYVAADQIVLSQNTYGIELVGPPRADYHWQAHEAQGFAAPDFKVDWDAQQLTCPQGHLSNKWTPLKVVPACRSSKSSSLPLIVGPVLAASTVQRATPASHVTP